MKFWVKAVNDSFQEQLLVDATNIDELHSQLQALLNVGPISRMSITDFHSQVTLKLNDGADIINVRIECGPGAAPSHESRESVSPRPGRRLSGSVNSQSREEDKNHASHPSASHPRPEREMTVTHGHHHHRENSLGGTSTGHHSINATSPFGGSHQNSPGTTPRAGSMPSASPGTLHRTNSGMGILDGTEHAPIERVVVKRADLASLIDATFSGTFNDAVCGSFVRLREANLGSSTVGGGGGYMVAQIAQVHSPTQVLVDLVHYAELRQLDVVSNSQPSPDELRAWHRKMIASSRTPPSQVFIEAKADALDSALRSVVSMTTPSPPSTNIGSATATGLGQSPPNTLRRRATIYSIHQQREDNQVRPVVGKALVPSNDMLINCTIAKTTDDGQWCVFASRHSNPKCKHCKPQDFSACVVTFNDDFSKVVEDRDVTAKGVIVSHGAPQLWNGFFHCAAHIATDALCSNPLHNYNTATDDYIALVGRDVKALYNSPIHFTLPVVPWAPEGRRYLPQFVVVGEVLHLFYLVSFIDGAGMKVEGLAHAATTDPKLQKWLVVSQDAPAVSGMGGAVFHASTLEMPGSPMAPPESGINVPPSTMALRIIFCSSLAADSPVINLLQNSDPGVSERSWSPVPAVCSIPQGDWRALGVQSIALFTYGKALYAAVNGEADHKHSSLYIVPVITS